MICTSASVCSSVLAMMPKRAISPGASTASLYMRTPLPKKCKHTSMLSLPYSLKASPSVSKWLTGIDERSSSSLYPETFNPAFEPVFMVLLPRPGLISAVSIMKKSTFGLVKISVMHRSMQQ